MLIVAGHFVVDPADQAAFVAGRADAVRTTRERYAGTWRVVALESGGTRVADGREIVVTNKTDGSWTITVGDKVISRGTSRINPAASPPEIDIEVGEGTGKGTTLLGIYELDETSRRLCFRGAGGARPREFATAPDCGSLLVTFERQ